MSKINTLSWSVVLAGFFACSGAAWGAAELPVNRIILSTSGLAQMEHNTTVTGNADLAFPVRFDQVDDILKSLVIFDQRGQVGGVTLPGKQPLDQIFKDLPFTRAQLGNTPALLNAYQGAVVAVKDESGSWSGKIIQVVPETVTLENNKTVTRHRLSLMTGEGDVRQVVIEDVNSLQFIDVKVREEIRKALDAVRDNSTSDRRMLTVSLIGTELRPVTLSYVVPAPLWKTAYRMVVPEAGKDTGFLQGWAVIENMTAGDWKDVDLSLVSGSPVTFKQALYQSYYVSRPEIPVQVFGLSLPRVDDGAIATADKMQTEYAKPASPKMMMQAQRLMNEAMPPGAIAGAAMDAASSMPMPVPAMEEVAQVANAAQSAETATQVLYRFPKRINLAAGQSLMLPFVSRAVPMERVSLYQPETNAKHPLAAIEIKNDGDTALPPGVLTLYAENKALKGVDFSGDAQLPVIAAGEKRLVSYALDTKTAIDREDQSEAHEANFAAAQGVLSFSMKSRMETNYTVKAPAKEDRVVMIEHPRMWDYKVVEPDPKTIEVTDKYYRIKSSLKAGETKTIRLVLENDQLQSYRVMDMDTQSLAGYAATRGDLKPATRKVFEELAMMRRALDAIDNKIAALEQQRQAIFQDQERVRQNLKSLTVKSDVQQKYLDKLNAQEDQVAKLDQEKQALWADREAKSAALNNKISTLTF